MERIRGLFRRLFRLLFEWLFSFGLEVDLISSSILVNPLRKILEGEKSNIRVTFLESWNMLWVRIFARFSRRFCLKPSRPLKFCDFAIALGKLIFNKLFSVLYQFFEEQREVRRNSLLLRGIFQFFRFFVFLVGIFSVIGNSDHSHLWIFSTERVTKILTFFFVTWMSIISWILGFSSSPLAKSTTSFSSFANGSSRIFRTSFYQIIL